MTAEPLSREQVVLVDGLRTPFCPSGAQLAHLNLQELGRPVLRELLERNDLDPRWVDQLFWGISHSNSAQINPARAIALRAGLPPAVPATTLQTGSGAGAAALVASFREIMAGRANLVIAGGADFTPPQTAGPTRKLLRQFSTRLRNPGGDGEITPDPKACMEREAIRLGITRQAQDQWVLGSQQRARSFSGRDLFREYIVPLFNARFPDKVFARDTVLESPLSEVDLATFSPLFDPRFGCITAGNSARHSDGAAALMLASRSFAEQKGLPILAHFEDVALDGGDRNSGLEGMVNALRKLLHGLSRNLTAVDLLEIHEETAAEVLGLMTRLSQITRSGDPLSGYTGEFTNLNGGALALGNPPSANLNSVS